MSDGLNGDKTGIKTVLRESFSPNDPVPGHGAVEQLALLPLSQVAGQEENAEPDPAVRGAGRPKGSRNRSTKEWQEFLLSRYQSPLVALAETYSRTPADIALELGFTKAVEGGRRATPEELFEIFKVQLQCAKELAPYVHQKQPLAIDAGAGGLIQLILNNSAVTPQQVESAGVMNIHFIDVESEPDQGLSGSAAGNSVVTDSVVNGKVQSDQSLNTTKPDDERSSGNGKDGAHV